MELFMQKMTICVLACWALAASPLSALCAIASSSDIPEEAEHSALCKEAIVNPVSGHAECVRPLGAPVAPPPPRPAVVKLAVFDFELEDATPASALLGQTASNEIAMEKVSAGARQTLAKSGRYLLVDVSEAAAKPVREKSLRNCEGCEAGIALEAGAEQALIGVVKRVTQTDYYIQVQITDAKTGKVLSQESANFAGGPDGWPSGVRMLLTHQVLIVEDES
jgi:Protein of unknown function (DUF2380)